MNDISPGSGDASAAPRRFSVLRSWKTAPYLVGSGTAMMGDNIEHVITYWVLWEKFESPALVGFQLISHWLPFLLLSVYAGSLAERFDCRRLIQIGQIMFMVVSLCWGILFLTDSLQLWQACVLLVIHGLAGCLWGPAEQMMLHDFVDRKELPSAVRLNATFRSLGILFGPVVGSALLLGVGATWGIFINIVFYLPLTLFLIRTPFTGHLRSGSVRTARTTLMQSLRVLIDVRHNRAILGMLLLAALASMTIGAVLQTAMPVFGGILTPSGGDSDFTYGVLLFAMGAGGVLGGFGLEADRMDQSRPHGCRAGRCRDGAQRRVLRPDLTPVGGDRHARDRRSLEDHRRVDRDGDHPTRGARGDPWARHRILCDVRPRDADLLRSHGRGARHDRHDPRGGHHRRHGPRHRGSGHRRLCRDRTEAHMTPRPGTDLEVVSVGFAPVKGTRHIRGPEAQFDAEGPVGDRRYMPRRRRASSGPQDRPAP